MEGFQNFFKTLLTAPHKATRSQEAENNKLKSLNSFNEIKLLTGHTDIIRVFEKIDSTTFASSSDDGNVIIWCSLSGKINHILKGHTKPVTCLLYLDVGVLVSGSVDRSLRFWKVETGSCIKIIPNSHESSVKCLTSVGSGKFCSGGNDRYLCLWDHSGNFLGSIERQEEENLHCLLAISENRAITGSNSSLLLVYRTDTLKFCKLFTFHRESVRCLATINDETFASGSLDGVIVVWDMANLVPMKKLCFPERFISSSPQHKYYAYTVNSLLVLGKRYLAACVGKGFRIYDTKSGECVMERQDAHDSTVFSIISLFKGKRFVTCSADAQIKLWASPLDFEFDDDTADQNDSFLKKKKDIWSPMCLGEMWAHTNQVKLLMKITETSFVSGGEDNLIILWKDGEEQSLLRNLDAAMAFVEDNSGLLFEQLEFYTNEDQDSSSGLYTANEAPIPEEYSGEDEREGDHTLDTYTDYDDKLNPNREIYTSDKPYSTTIPIKLNNLEQNVFAHTPLIVPTVLNEQQCNVRVPAYIYDYAFALYTEDNISLEMMYEVLKKEGHSESIAMAVCEKLKQEMFIKEIIH